ncbi:MAG: hypothetical protein HND57_16700 [Planctomycetes bacterium]|nr:hypothetical protein [Planctomycetota bacterium]
MSGWVQILIFVLIALGPAAGRIFQEVSKKRAQQRSLDEKERDMLTGRNVRGKSQRGSRQPQARSQADAAAAGLTPEQRATQAARLGSMSGGRLSRSTGLRPGNSSSRPGGDAHHPRLRLL